VNGEFQEAVGGLNIMADSVFNRDFMMLKYQYNPKLDNAKRKVTKLKGKIEEMRKQHHTHNELAGLHKEIRDSEEIAKTLRNKQDNLERFLTKENIITSRIEKHNQGRREVLNKLNKDNLGVRPLTVDLVPD